MTPKQQERYRKSIASMHERVNRLIDPLMAKLEDRTIDHYESNLLSELCRAEAALGTVRHNLYREVE